MVHFIFKTSQSLHFLISLEIIFLCEKSSGSFPVFFVPIDQPITSTQSLLEFVIFLISENRFRVYVYNVAIFSYEFRTTRINFLVYSLEVTSLFKPLSVK